MAKSSRISVLCTRCHGSGRVELNGVNAETLALLRRQRSEVCGKDLADLAGCSNESMCNRLRAIEQHGLAESRKWGRKVFWKAK